MKNNRVKILIFALILAFIASSIAGAGEDEGIKVKVLDLLSKFPAQNTVERDALASEIIIQELRMNAGCLPELLSRL